MYCQCMNKLYWLIPFFTVSILLFILLILMWFLNQLINAKYYRSHQKQKGVIKHTINRKNFVIFEKIINKSQT